MAKQFCSMDTSPFELSSKAHQIDHVYGNSALLDPLADLADLIERSLLKMSVGSIIAARDQETVHAIEAPVICPPN